MLIKRIKARNFKTYLQLDLDLTVEPDKPVILIGGANGGGKTTLFEAIYAALYGLKIRNARHFEELFNAGNRGEPNRQILLEIHFSGKVLNEDQQYVLTRIYALNTANQPVESVKLNMSGNIFQYGTATPVKDRQRAEAEVKKIIKANLPEELSRYFLFDAMESGNLLKEDQLNRVIKENIENVMGFHKYVQMAQVSEQVLQHYTAQRIQLEKEKNEYLALIEQKKQLEARLREQELQHQDALQYAVNHKELYDGTKAGLAGETTIKSKIGQVEQQVKQALDREQAYVAELDLFVKSFELQVVLPNAAHALRNEVNLVLKSQSEEEQRKQQVPSTEVIEKVVADSLQWLLDQGYLAERVDAGKITDWVARRLSSDAGDDPYSFLEIAEQKALEQLITNGYTNSFYLLHQQQTDLQAALLQIPKWKNQVDEYKKQITGVDYSFIKKYEENESLIKSIDRLILDTKTELEKIETRIHHFDIQLQEGSDPRYEVLMKLKPFFNHVVNTLLKSKKKQIEARMLQDLNTTLVAYQNVIDKVELSEDLKDLTFKIYHRSGNEISLNQLNTASKQVVVQCLLKALHEYGDYNPPVMIDTVMGVLDETSRATVLENYFPQLSQQTILLSSDSEIRKDKDLAKIGPFISRLYTLVRDKQQQKSEVLEGYFGVKEIE